MSIDKVIEMRHTWLCVKMVPENKKDILSLAKRWDFGEIAFFTREEDGKRMFKLTTSPGPDEDYYQEIGEEGMYLLYDDGEWADQDLPLFINEEQRMHFYRKSGDIVTITPKFLEYIQKAGELDYYTSYGEDEDFTLDADDIKELKQSIAKLKAEM